MKLVYVASCALLASAMTGCIAAGEQSPNGELGSTQQAIEGENQTPVPAIPGTPIFAQYLAGAKELDLQSCNVQHPGPLDPANPADWPCLAMYPDRKFDVVNVLVTNERGRIVGNHIVDDRPGGGCIHMNVPEAVVGGRVYVVVTGKNLDGSGRAREQVYFFNLKT